MTINLTQDSFQATPEILELPPKFTSIQSIMDMPNERLVQKPMINVIGLVRDFQPPIQTRGTDYKCTINIFDFSTQEENQYGKTGIEISAFYPLERMPHISGPGDVLLIRNIKVQMYGGFISLLANYNTEFNVMVSGAIPAWPLSHPLELKRATVSKNKPLSQDEAVYVVWLKCFIKTDVVPTAMEFQKQQAQAMNAREKFSLLKDLKENHFYDLIVEVVQTFENSGRATVYCSDYTAHPLFYNNVWGESTNMEVDGDEYGYTAEFRRKSTKEGQWPGPYGKMSLQLTAFDGHAEFIRDEIKAGDWVKLKNVHIRMAKIGGCLEGFLRGDRNSFESKVQVQVLSQSEESHMNDPRWVDAVRRRLVYWQRFKEQERSLLNGDDNEPTGKRKRSEDNGNKRNAKKLRKKKRADVEQDISNSERQEAEALDLNFSVRCSAEKRQSTPLSVVLDRSNSRITLPQGGRVLSAFTNLKYRVNLRVVDYWPHALEAFSVGRRKSEYDMLPEYSGGESTDNEIDMKLYKEGKGFGGQKRWEWRFSLLVEEVSNTTAHEQKRDRIWLIVDNISAQMLLNLDAVDLRADSSALDNVREKLFTLWGDLEEKKTAYLKTKAGKTLLWASTNSASACDDSSDEASETEPLVQVKTRAIGDQPSDSDDEKQATLKAGSKGKVVQAVLGNRSVGADDPSPLIQDDPKAIRKLNPEEAKLAFASRIVQLGARNKGFAACIQQYGIKVPEANEDKADAGEGKRWQRMFGLFGTSIL